MLILFFLIYITVNTTFCPMQLMHLVCVKVKKKLSFIEICYFCVINDVIYCNNFFSGILANCKTLSLLV